MNSARTTSRHSVATTQSSDGDFEKSDNDRVPPVDLNQLNGFSWWDLNSLGQFIANDQTTKMAEGVLSTPDIDSEAGMSGFDNAPESMWYGNLVSIFDAIFCGSLHLFEAKIMFTKTPNSR